MGKISKKISSFILSAIVLSTGVFSACSKKNENNGENVKFWTAPSYVKIYQDIDYSSQEEYSSFYNADELNVSMFKNEKEGGHVILTPDYDVQEYTVAVTDLVADNGQKISKENITVYNQKYVDVTFASKAHTNSVLGMVPDAILPFEKAVEYGENTISKAQNQGIYIEIDSKGVEQGTYVGNVQITVDGKVRSVKMTANVWGAEVSEENHLKSSFLLRQKELLDNEKDGTDEMYTKYYEQFLDYRLNITKFTQTFEEEPYIQGLRKYYPDPRISTLHFPRCENGARNGYDYDLAQTWFKKIAELCFEDETNYYSKLYYYLAIIDEPHITKTQDKVSTIFKGFAVARHTVINELQTNKESYDVSDELFKQVIDGIENFPLLLTSSYNETYTYEKNKLQNYYIDYEGNYANYANKDAEGNITETEEEFNKRYYTGNKLYDRPKAEPNPDEEYVITWVPYMSVYDTEASGERHENEHIDEWWYGCNYPTNPYPTYHLDDALLTSRVFSWMAYEHNVVGNLYWRVNYTSEKNSFGVSETVEDPYDITNPTQETNGEGMLVYPGMPYGIDGFVPSLRLISIRDGMEEYEILRSTGEKCKELASSVGYTDFDINTTFSKLYRALYQGAKVTGTASDFSQARELLSRFAMLIENGAMITDVQNKNFSTLVKVYVSSGTLKVNGAEANFIGKGDGKEYTVEINQTEKENYLDFTLEQGTGNTVFRMFVGGKKQAIELAEVSFVGNDKINDNTVVKNGDGSVTVTMSGVKTKEDGSHWEDERQRLHLVGDVLSKTLKKSMAINTIAIEIENSGEAFDLQIQYVGSRTPGEPYDFARQKVAAGTTTTVIIEIGAFKWDNGTIDELWLYFAYADVLQERTVTIKSIILTF